MRFDPNRVPMGKSGIHAVHRCQQLARCTALAAVLDLDSCPVDDRHIAIAQPLGNHHAYAAQHSMSQKLLQIERVQACTSAISRDTAQASCAPTQHTSACVAWAQVYSNSWRLWADGNRLPTPCSRGQARAVKGYATCGQLGRRRDQGMLHGRAWVGAARNSDHRSTQRAARQHQPPGAHAATVQCRRRC